MQDDLVYFGDFRLESGYEITKEILKKKKRPTAIYACNNMMALGCVKAIVEEGLKIPEDISFICFDDVEMFEIMNLNISTVSRPTVVMGEVAAEMMFDLIGNDEAKNAPIREMLLETKLVLRGSEKKH